MYHRGKKITLYFMNVVFHAYECADDLGIIYRLMEVWSVVITNCQPFSKEQEGAQSMCLRVGRRIFEATLLKVASDDSLDALFLEEYLALVAKIIYVFRVVAVHVPEYRGFNHSPPAQDQSNKTVSLE